MYNSIGIALTLSIVGLTFALISTNAELRSIKNILKEALSKKEDVKLFGIIVPNYDEIKKLLNKEDLDKEEVHKLIAEEVRKANRQMPIYKAVKDFEIRETELVKTTTKKIKRSANI